MEGEADEAVVVVVEDEADEAVVVVVEGDSMVVGKTVVADKVVIDIVVDNMDGGLEAFVVDSLGFVELGWVMEY